MPISSWTVNAASNNSAVPNGWPEAMAPSGVNDVGRQMMADIRTWYGAFELKNSISPAAMGATENNYAPTGFSDASVLRLTPNAANTSLTGIAGGADGRLIVVINIHATAALTLADESASSSAANRFALTVGLTVPAKGSAVFWYDGTSSRWRFISGDLA